MTQELVLSSQAEHKLWGLVFMPRTVMRRCPLGSSRQANKFDCFRAGACSEEWRQCLRAYMNELTSRLVVEHQSTRQNDHVASVGNLLPARARSYWPPHGSP